MANRFVASIGEGLHILPGVHNALSAVLAEMAGLEAVFVTGAGVSNNFLGEPDLGFLTFDQLKAHVEQILQKVAIPVFVDFDAGYGDAKLAYRQGRQLQQLGVAGVFIEDQVQPKRCGHFAGKRVIAQEEMVEKVAAVREVSDDWIVVARTDALSVETFEQAMDRISAYHGAGADVTFLEAPTSREQLKAIGSLGWPQVVNIVEGGKTPLIAHSEIMEMGFAIALYANFASRIAMQAMKVAYKSLAVQGDTSVLMDDMVTFEERQAILGLQAWEAFEKRMAGGKVPSV